LRLESKHLNRQLSWTYLVPSGEGVYRRADFIQGERVYRRAAAEEEDTQTLVECLFTIPPLPRAVAAAALR
jgi:hypothetical protein